MRNFIEVNKDGNLKKNHSKNAMDILEILGQYFYNGIMDVRICNKSADFNTYAFASTNTNATKVSIKMPNYIEENKAYNTVCNNFINTYNKEALLKTCNGNLVNTSEEVEINYSQKTM